MNKSVLRQQIAYRCPECGVATVGFLGGLAAVSDMLRLKCDCDAYSLDIKKEGEGKVRLSVPCVYCKDTHSYVIGAEVITRDATTRLSCPHSGQDILFIAESEAMGTELDRSAEELSRILLSFEADDIKDIQPTEIDEAEAAPDAGIYDVINFVVRDLEDAGGIHCPCAKGPYSVRFCEEGAEVCCVGCGASYIFHAKSAAAAEAYLSVDEITLR